MASEVVFQTIEGKTMGKKQTASEENQMEADEKMWVPEKEISEEEWAKFHLTLELVTVEAKRVEGKYKETRTKKLKLEKKLKKLYARSQALTAFEKELKEEVA